MRVIVSSPAQFSNLQVLFHTEKKLQPDMFELNCLDLTLHVMLHDCCTCAHCDDHAETIYCAALI